MNLSNIIEVSIEIILFLIISYFVFYKSFLKALGRQFAKVATVEKLTFLEQNVKKDFNEKLEEYKARLNEDLSLKLEPIKADLAKNNITHQIQFSFLHQERAKVILDIYKRLIELHSAMAMWTAALQPVVEDAEKESEERMKNVNTAITDFQKSYFFNKVFFSKDFCRLIDEIFQEYWEKGWDFGFNQARLKSGQVEGEYYKYHTKELNKISKEIREKLPPKIQEIESKFRALLSVNDTDPPV